MTGRERCLAVLRGQIPDRTPVFPLVMHLAQRRHGISYRTFAGDGQALAEAQLHLADDFPVDAITACSDAYRVVADLGAAIAFPLDHPPHAAPLVRCRADLQALRRPDPLRPGSRLADRVAAVAAMHAAAGRDLLVAGWVDMPFAEACSLCGVEGFMTLLYDDPELADDILAFLAPIVADAACAQLAAGAPLIGCGDAAASLLSPKLYRRFALPWEQRTIVAIHRHGGLAKLHICGDTRALLGDLASTGADLINVDHLVPLADAGTALDAAGRAWKGGIDPVATLHDATPERAAAAAADFLRHARGRVLLSCGCEVPAATSAEAFGSFCRAPACVSHQ